MANNEPTQHYKDLQEMLESPEHKKLERLVRQGCEEGIIDVYPPLPKNEELNKKLAEWAGIKWKITERTYNHLEQDIWIYPDGTIKDEPPDFTQSLDACFKWLVPKSIDKIMARLNWSRGAALDILFANWRHELENEVEQPALALCLAIEQLIDKETR